MLNLLPEAHEQKNEGLLFAYSFGTLNGSSVLGATSPHNSSLSGKGMGLTFTSPVLHGCWMGWPSCFNVLGFRPQVLTKGVLSETTRSQTGNLSAFSLLLSSPFSTPNPCPLPIRQSLLTGLCQLLPLRGKACLALGSPMLLPRPTLAGAGRIALMGLAAASNEGLPRALPLSSGPLNPGVSRSTLENKKTKKQKQGKSPRNSGPRERKPKCNL